MKIVRMYCWITDEQHEEMKNSLGASYKTSVESNEKHADEAFKKVIVQANPFVITDGEPLPEDYARDYALEKYLNKA